MNPRILLVNFTKKEAEKLKDLPYDVDRGYLSDLRGEIKSLKEIGEAIKCYFPYSIHEYKVIFINLCSNPEIDKEFDGLVEPYSKRKIDEFIDYWLVKEMPMIIFLGDYSLASLLHLGVRGITLENVTSRDKTVNSTKEFNKFFKKVENEVIMPTHRYIRIEEEEDSFYVKFKNSFCIKDIYLNNAGDILACYHNTTSYKYDCQPSLVLLPQFKEKELVIRGLLKELSKIYTKYLSELYEPDWRESSKYFPREVQSYDDKIDKLVILAQKKIKELGEVRKRSQEKYRSLLNLVTQKDNELKDSVIDVLRNIFHLKVIDMDEEKEETVAHEDIIVDLDGEFILAEIKGDISKYPSSRHIAQLWKHLKHNRDIQKGALILNYDFNTAPEERDLAYTGEEESDLDDIIFIDSRILLSLALAIIDYKMPPERAREILFQKGRVAFDLEEYEKSLIPQTPTQSQ